MKPRRWLGSLARALLVVTAILLCAAAWLWFTEVAPSNARRESAQSYARRLEARFRSEGRYKHLRITDTGDGGGGLLVSGEVLRGELQELKRVVQVGSPVEYIEYHVVELDAETFDAAERKGVLTPPREPLRPLGE